MSILFQNGTYDQLIGIYETHGVITCLFASKKEMLMSAFLVEITQNSYMELQGFF